MSATEPLLRSPRVSGSPRTVRWDDDGLRIAGRSTPLISGTLEYWRVNSLYWRRCLERMREAGMRQVSSFVCWDFHELEDGSFDFTGRTHPSRDLAGFIDLCGEHGLDFLVRLGPIIDAEWPTRGPAPDVCELERIDPVFRARTEEYLDAVLEHLVPRQATRGGPIVLVDLDNEPYFPYSTDAGSDSSEGAVEIPYRRDLVLGRYSEWLRGRYADDEALRRAWDDPSASLEAPREPDYGNDSRAAVLDSFDFITDVLSETFTWMRDACLARGVEVPTYSNSKQFTHYLDWRQIEEVVESNGLGMWFDDMLPGDQPLVASWYVRLQRAVTRFPWAGEMQAKAARSVDEPAGIPSDGHYRYLTELAVAFGLRGFCYYPLVERDDALFAPIGATGKARPRLGLLEEGIAMATEAGNGRQLHDIALLWSIDHHRAAVAAATDSWENLHRIWIELESPKELPRWWSAFVALQRGDRDFTMLPLESPRSAAVLLYAGPSWVRPAAWQRVVERVEEGAVLVVVDGPPDEGLAGPDDRLAALNERLRRSGRMTVVGDAAPQDLLRTLDRAGARRWCDGGAAGVWTFAYADATRHLFFVANVGEESRRTEVHLDGSLAAELAGRTARDLIGGERWQLDGPSLAAEPLELPPSSVRAIEVVA